MREQIILEMTQTASSIYLETQRYWRAAAREAASEERLAGRGPSLDERYYTARVSEEALEIHLPIYFTTTKPRRLWHATMDLLTVRYFQLINPANDGLLSANAGPEHSGLTAEQLKNPKPVLDTYRARLFEATRAVLDEPSIVQRRRF